MEKRQLINIARPTETLSSVTPSCSAFTLPGNGLLTLNASTTLTLTSDAIYEPKCTGSSDVIIAGSGAANHIHFRDPFYASTIPECYALAATTVIAYMLVIMLLITPRTFLHEGALVLGRRGFTSGPSAGEVGIGGRPLLQKVAVLTVAISLTIATADTFRVAEAQYKVGYMDAQALQTEVEDSTELKVIRVISDTFLWLAQAQTLIRLFPRQREKVIIKWTAFALITLDELFSILNNFAYEGSSRPRSFVYAVPALAYLFRLALSLLYAAWVIYYSISKKEFAFYYPQMKNISLVALISLLSVLVPVVFFITDISKPDLAGWGDYVRWVGAAAASVVVWEWVERIEALERNEKKDDVLGREVFDGDEMLDAGSSSSDMPHIDSPKYNNMSDGDSGNGGNGVDGDGISSGAAESKWPIVSGLANRFRFRRKHDIESARAAPQTNQVSHRPTSTTMASPTSSYIKPTDTPSANSTVLTVMNPHVNEDTQSITGDSQDAKASPPSRIKSPAGSNVHQDINPATNHFFVNEIEEEDNTRSQLTTSLQASSKVNTSKKRGQEPPSEVFSKTSQPQRLVGSQEITVKQGVRAIIQNFACTQVDKIRQTKPRNSVGTHPLPKTVIPAPPRRSDMAAIFQQLEESQRSNV